MPMLLSPHIHDFLACTLAMEVASISPEFTPSSARAYAVRIEGERIKMFVERNLAGDLLHDLLSSNRIAAVFCKPESEQALQIKGTDVQLSPLASDDADQINKYCENFVDAVCPLGFMRPFVAAYIGCDLTQAIAISFTPTEIFEQTPGPRAGQQLVGAAQ